MAVELFFQKGIGLVRPYSLASAGLVADPGVQVTLSHPPGGMASNTFRQAAVISVAFTRWRQPQHTSDSSSLLIYRPQKDKRLSRPGWLTCSGWFTHNSGHPSAARRVWDRESSPARDRRSTTVPRNHEKSCITQGGCTALLDTVNGHNDGDDERQKCNHNSKWQRQQHRLTATSDTWTQTKHLV